MFTFTKNNFMLALLALTTIYLLLAFASAATERPGIDEGCFANPALNLIRSGHFGTTVLDSSANGLTRIEQRTYWVMPLHLLLQAAWYKVFGFSLFTMRGMSIFWGLIALFSWFFILKTLSGSREMALLMFFLMSVDYIFINIASSGRMDMMSAALGALSFLTYLKLREKNLYLAILLSQSLVVCSGLTHPNGGLVAFFGSLFLVLYFDHNILRLKHLAFGIIPYIVGGACWLIYIMQDPIAFKVQFTANATMSGRLSLLSAPWRGFFLEFQKRYPLVFGLSGHSAGRTGPIYLKSIVLVAYLAGVIGSLLKPNIRRHKGLKALLFLTTISFCVLAIFDGQKSHYNMIHIAPLYVALLSSWVYVSLNEYKSKPLKTLFAISLLGVAMLQAGGIFLRAAQNSYSNDYLPAVNYLKQHALPSDLIMGNAALGFGLGFPDNLTDDVRLGFFSGKKPDYIVIEGEYDLAHQVYKEKAPEIYSYILKTLKDYQLVYVSRTFRIYHRNNEHKPSTN